jgi:hypothetical protein
MNTVAQRYSKTVKVSHTRQAQFLADYDVLETETTHALSQAIYATCNVTEIWQYTIRPYSTVYDNYEGAMYAIELEAMQLEHAPAHIAPHWTKRIDRRIIERYQHETAERYNQVLVGVYIANLPYEMKMHFSSQRMGHSLIIHPLRHIVNKEAMEDFYDIRIDIKKFEIFR